ncbi:MAG: hypothetical protein ABJH98_18380 [Reichenbachiella sp.]|uniref:hypothetical protein n=1 Tax=Reichenbachiella sp. TaxID=2184521 RepID=UPI0032982313
MDKLILKFTAAILMLTLVLFSSCKDDDDVEINQANLTGGTWVYDHADAGDDFANAFIDAFLEGSEYEFKSDKTYASIQLGFENEGSWSFSDDKITLDAGEDYEEIWTLIELSSKTLHYESTTIDDESGDESTVAYVYKR